jgi:hypothetical protein
MTTRKAYYLGAQAAKHGRPFGANPFSTDQLCKAWDAGYRFGQAHIVGGGLAELFGGG